MASIFRSEEMTLCQLFLSSEASYNCLSLLGELGLVQFKDLNSSVNSFQRQFVNEIRRCDEMELKLKFFEAQIKKDKIEILDDNDNPAAPQPNELTTLEIMLEKLDNELREVNDYEKNLRRNFIELTELKYTLETLDLFCGGLDLEPTASMSQNLIPMEEAKGGSGMDLGYMTGVVKRAKMPVLERLLWRISRGNAFMRAKEIEKPIQDAQTGEEVDKVAFIIFYQGETLRVKINKICEACKATLYICPESNDERVQMLEGVKNRIADLNIIFSHTNEHRLALLHKISKYQRVWLIKVRKVKGIYHTMNMFNIDVTTKCYIAEAWIPTTDILTIRTALLKGTKMSGIAMEPIIHELDTEEPPPTLHKTNKFTKAFQKLIDAYGVATYREVNPGLYTTTTFPFLFAVMFGDCGHGIIFLLFGAWMIYNEKKITAQKSKNEIWNMFFGGRYIITMMGCFSIYTGAIYNDMFSKSLSVFSSKWHVGSRAEEVTLVYNEPVYMLDPAEPEDYEGNPYPFGLDPIWQLSINKINFLNSFKMKISIIIGVLHMCFGLSLSLVNHLHFKRYINIFFDFIPQLLFLVGLFGYLCIMVIYKWFSCGSGDNFRGDNRNGENFDTHCAPSILILFIDMFLFKNESLPDQTGQTEPCTTMYLYDGQLGIQKVVIIFSVLMIPLMLIPKPAILNHREKKEKLAKIQQEEFEMIDKAGTSSTAEAEDGKAVDKMPVKNTNAGPQFEEEDSEFFLHQGIHTIEFTLGCVSHTASYLRLWALSLAHAQLSEVLWMMVMSIGLQQSSTTGSIVLYCIFAAWGALTISILVVMEGLSAFLHTLRLHWVEFCSKFYEREGYLFYPFKFKHFVDVDDD